MDEAGQLEAGGSSIGRTSTKPAPDGRASEHVFVGHPSGKWARVRHVARRTPPFRTTPVQIAHAWPCSWPMLLVRGEPAAAQLTPHAGRTEHRMPQSTKSRSTTKTAAAAKRAAKTATKTTKTTETKNVPTTTKTAAKTASRKTAAKRGTKTERRATAAAIATHVVRVPAAALLETNTATHVSRSKSALESTKTRGGFKLASVDKLAKSVRITYANGSTIRPGLAQNVYALVPVTPEPVAEPVKTRAKRAAVSVAKTGRVEPTETAAPETDDVLSAIAEITAKIEKRGHATSAESRKLDALRAQRDAATKNAKRAKTSGRKTTTKIGTAAVAKYADTATAATNYMNAAASGGRNPVSTQNVADVAQLVGRKNAIAAICGESASLAECKRLVRGTETKNATAIRAALRDFAQKITDASDSGRTTKIRGAKLLGIAIALAESK
jgi:hypothetical protein